MNRIIILLLYEVARSLPQLITGMFLIAYMLDLLLPNRKKNSIIVGVILSEIMEHVFLPVFIIIASLIYPPLHIPMFLFFGMFIYGRLLGKIETEGDFYKVMTICVMLYFIMIWMPVGLWMLGTEFNFWYIYSCPTVIVISTMVYIIIKKRVIHQKVLPIPQKYPS